LLVCHCHNVCDRVIRQCVREGAQTVGAVKAACSAGGSCGGCVPMVHRLVLAERVRLAHERAEDAASDAAAASMNPASVAA
jgi:NAD(P)H-nitrite reductase large subunit